MHAKLKVSATDELLLGAERVCMLLLSLAKWMLCMLKASEELNSRHALLGSRSSHKIWGSPDRKIMEHLNALSNWMA